MLQKKESKKKLINGYVSNSKMVSKVRRKRITCFKAIKKTRLRSLIAYNQRNAAKFHDVRYYLSQQIDTRNQEYKLNLKRNLAVTHKKIITEIIENYKEYAKNYTNKAWLILNGIHKRNVVAALKNEAPPTHSDLMGLVSSLPMLLIAYKQVRKNKGAMTLAFHLSKDRKRNLSRYQISFLNKTFGMPDGMSVKLLNVTSDLIKSGRYPWGASRRIWLDKPGSKIKGTRPITIPPFMDRVVQTAIKMVLEAIYEPWFEKTNRSFGFRSNKGCHDAIFALTTPITKSSRFALEGDFSKAYDSVNKKLLLQFLGKRIKDTKFLNMMEARLKYQFFDTRTESYVNENFLGIPQGGTDSPYLFNIYLSEFDDYVINMTNEVCNKLNTKIKLWDSSKEARPLRKKIETKRNWLKKYSISANPTRDELENRYNKVKEIRLLRHEVLKLNSSDLGHQRLKLFYTRYADDWILLTNGPRLLLEKIKKKISKWAKSNLEMTLSQDKTLITDLLNEPAHFLGYEIKGNRYKKIEKIKMMVGRTTKTAKDMLKKVSGQLIHAYPDRQRLLSRFCMKGYCDKRGFPRELPFLTNFDAHTIISRYNSVIRGIFDYYAQFTRYGFYLNRWFYILKYSCLKTLAHKFKISVRKVLNQFKVNTIFGRTIGCKVNIKINGSTYTKNWNLLTYKEIIHNCSINSSHYMVVKDAFWTNEQGHQYRYPYKIGQSPSIKNYDFIEKINWVNVRTQAGLELPCSICGAMGSTEMHHIKHIRKESLTHLATPWKKQMYLRNRKQIPLCFKCHRMVHNVESNYSNDELISLVPVKKLYDNRIINIESQIKTGKFYGSKSLEQKGWTQT